MALLEVILISHWNAFKSLILQDFFRAPRTHRGSGQSHVACVRRKKADGWRARCVRRGQAGTFLYCWQRHFLCRLGRRSFAGDAQEQPAPQAARDANAQAITLDTINVQGDSGGTDGYVANQHVGRDQDQHAADQHSAVDHGRDQGLHQGPELPEPHRRHALRSGRRRASGRRQPRRTRHPRRRFKRELLRQRLSRRRSISPRSLQHAKHRGPEGAERADLRPRRRRRPCQPHAQGSRRHADLRGDGADRLLLATGASPSMPARPSTQNFAARLNVLYEGSDTFRDYGKLERYGINPTVTLQAERQPPRSSSATNIITTSARPIAAILPRRLSAVAPASTRFNPAAPFAPNGDLTAFFGSPNLNVARANVQTVDGRHRARLRQRTDGEELDALRRLQEILPERLSRQRRAGGRGQSRRHRVQSARPTTRDQPREPLQPDRLRLQDLHRAGLPYDCVRHRVRPADRHRLPQHRHLSERHQHDDRQSVRSDLFRDGQLHPSVPGANARRHRGRLQQQISPQHRVGLCARHDRNHALAAIDRRRALRSLRHVGAGHEYEHRPRAGSTTRSRRRPP